MKITRYLISTALLLGFVLLTNVHAQAISIGTAPTFEKLQLEPGQIYEGEITVWNLQENTTNYFVKVSSFRQIQNQPGSAIFLTDEEDKANPYSASSWVKLDTTEVELIPNRNITIDYTITVPETLTLGEYTAEIYLISEDPDSEDITATYTVLAAGVPILITIGDEFAESAEILDFYTEKKYYEKPNFTKFITRLKNLGDTHITPKGDIVLTNIFNKEVGRIPFNLNNQSILRDNAGLYEDVWDLQKYITEENRIVVGPITATAIVLFRRTNPGFSILEASTTFWIIPWKLIIVVLVAIIVIYVSIRISKRSKKNSTIPNNSYPR